jgi:hypothetical protein
VLIETIAKCRKHRDPAVEIVKVLTAMPEAIASLH